MDKLQKLIENQMKKHMYYVNSFKRAELTISNEHYHPKTGKRINCSQMSALIQKDLEKRSKAIIKFVTGKQLC